MTSESIPSPELLRKLLRYDPETGELFWRERPREFFKTDRDCNIWNTRFAGAEAGSVKPDGYRRISVLNRTMRAHRVVWAMQTGEWPTDQIDHENHNRDDNRWRNLRGVTHAENGRNQSLMSTNTSGVCGVSWHKQTGKWMSRIEHDGKRRSLGLFTDLTEAAAARTSAERALGFHINHGLKT